MSGGLGGAAARLLGSWAERVHRRPAAALVVATLLTAVAGFVASGLTLRADLTELLPSSFESVRNIERLQERFGGVGYVVVVGRDASPEALIRFADAVAPKLEEVAGIRFVEHRRATRFFADHALYYLSTDDLSEVERRLKSREKWERRQRNPLFVSFEEEEAPSIDFADLEAKYGNGSDRRLAGGGEEYYLDKSDRMIVLLAKPEGTSIDLAFSQALLGRVEAMLATVNPHEFGPDFRVQLTGTYKKKVDQQRQITHDVATASIVAGVLLLAFLLFHLSSLVALGLNLVPVVVGLAWTYGLIAATYGSLNLLTGFLGAIIGGLGVEHGIHLLGRYETLRGEGHDSASATRETFSHTGTSALVSALVAALTFASLALSEFRAFREFGLTAGLGMVVLIAAYLLVLPALLGVASRLGWKPRRRPTADRASRLTLWLPRFRAPLAIAVGLAFVGSLLVLHRVRFDYDLAALEDGNLPSFALDRKVNVILGYSQTPAVVLTESPAAERAVVAELDRRRTALGAASTIDFVAALEDLVPADQAAKAEIIGRIAVMVDKVSPDRLEPAMRERFATLRRTVTTAPFTREELPASVRRQFAGNAASHSGFVLIFPSVRLSDGAGIQTFVDQISGLKLPDGTNVSAAGEAMILADVIHMVTRESFPILLAALASVLLATWFSLGRLSSALLCLAPTVVSVLALVGLMPVIGETFNYLNILVIPVLVGVTVDAGVHLVSRLSEDVDFAAVYAETGRAICGGLVTSAVGFAALLLADHPGLNSIGRLAILGFAVNLLVTLVGFPALILLLTGRRRAVTTNAPLDLLPPTDPPALPESPR